MAAVHLPETSSESGTKVEDHGGPQILILSVSVKILGLVEHTNLNHFFKEQRL